MPCGCSSGGRRWVAGPEASLSLSGVPVVISPAAHWLRRLLWALILALAMSWLVYLLCTSTMKLINRSLKDDMKVVRGFDVPFPAVTVCAGQRYNPERVSRMLQDGISLTDWNPSKDITHYRFLRWEELNFDEFFERSSYNWSELVARCTVFGRPCEELGTVSRAITYSRGICHTLRLSEPVQGTWIEPQVSLHLTLPEWNQSQINKEWVVFLHPASLVFNSASFSTGLLNIIPILPGSESWIRIKRRQSWFMNTEEKPCTDDTDWNEILSCANECILTKSDSTIASNNTTSKDISRDSESVDSPSAICRLPWFSDFGDGACTTYKDLEIALNVHPGYATLTEKDLFTALMTCFCPYFCSDIQYLADTPDRLPLVNGARSRDAMLKIWISIDQEVVTENWNYELPQFIADCGGNIGLFLGASLLSLVEILDVASSWLVRRAIRAEERTRVSVTPWMKVSPGCAGS